MKWKENIENIFIFINVLLLVLGIAISGVALAFLFGGQNRILLELIKEGNKNQNDTFSIVCIVSIVAGACIILIAFLGLWRARKNSKCFICLYVILLTVINILALAAIICSILLAIWVHENTIPELKSKIIREYTEIPSDSYSFSDVINNAHVSLKCCGIDGYTDFNKAKKWDNNNGTIKIPLTCCVLNNPDSYYEKPCAAIAKFAKCQTAPSDNNSYFKKGCADVFLDYANTRSLVVGSLALVVFIIQLSSIACCWYLHQNTGLVT